MTETNRDGSIHDEKDLTEAMALLQDHSVLHNVLWLEKLKKSCLERAEVILRAVFKINSFNKLEKATENICEVSGQDVTVDLELNRRGKLVIQRS